MYTRTQAGNQVTLIKELDRLPASLFRPHFLRCRPQPHTAAGQATQRIARGAVRLFISPERRTIRQQEHGWPPNEQLNYRSR
ncbi:MAG: hypothetical protein FWD96_03080 [Defluviitaleaceae bacterium]|nr:hypothetical protein [Defluviitaleaceae bacterium]